MKSDWSKQFVNIGYMQKNGYGRSYRARREAYHESERYLKIWARKKSLFVSRCQVCDEFVAWNKEIRKIHLVTKDDYGYFFNDKDFHSVQCRIQETEIKQV